MEIKISSRTSLIQWPFILKLTPVWDLKENYSILKRKKKSFRKKLKENWDKSTLKNILREDIENSLLVKMDLKDLIVEEWRLVNLELKIMKDVQIITDVRLDKMEIVVEFNIVLLRNLILLEILLELKSSLLFRFIRKILNWSVWMDFWLNMLTMDWTLPDSFI